MIQINSLDIPSEFIDLCSQWYYGQDDTMYAVASTGGLTLGNRRPYNDEELRPMTDEEWYIRLWECLERDVRHARLVCEKSPHGYDLDDAAELLEFEEWIEKQVSTLKGE